MIYKKCIIFDNEDQSEEIIKLIRDAHSKGIDIECDVFYVGSTFFTDVLTEGKIDIQKVVSEFKKSFGGQTYHLAAFDWSLDDDNINGVELIRQLSHNKILKNTPKLIYSGVLEDVLSGIENLSPSDRLNRIKPLINSKILGYYERTKRDEEIMLFFSQDIESLDLILEEQLRKYPDLIFEHKFVTDTLKGKSFLQVAEFIEEHDHIRNDLKKEIIQQVIAYMTENIS